jgi:hypothetical protein
LGMGQRLAGGSTRVTGTRGFEAGAPRSLKREPPKARAAPLDYPFLRRVRRRTLTQAVAAPPTRF